MSRRHSLYLDCVRQTPVETAQAIIERHSRPPQRRRGGYTPPQCSKPIKHLKATQIAAQLHRTSR